RNDRGRRFIDVTKESGVAGSGTAVIADIDNDGLPDIYFCGGTGKLYHNLGKMRFEDWTKKVPPNKHQRSLAAAFGDLDGDGYVDLYVTNYEDWKDNTYPYAAGEAGTVVHFDGRGQSDVRQRRRVPPAFSPARAPTTLRPHSPL